ncbi:MAG: glyoxalase/bleomycin resistance/dioxygenase family protein [Alphaproteobacteria bacterium]|nr:MAG: glyoxalase/bleomycin resistance/dioxygenase family protein [Alphaproteobacteria bacterium]
MKRLHVNLAVADLEESIRFYSTLFAAAPCVVKDDYAKWMLEDPRVNFAITTRGSRKGIDHLGIQVESEAELNEVHGRLKAAGRPILEQGETTCCYAVSKKNWIADPEGIAWETFFTLEDSPVYGSDLEPDEAAAACCLASDEEAGETAERCCD